MRLGDVFAGDFRIEAPLAMGGMGAVYVAEQLSTGRKRALKLMHPSLVENPRTRERFEQEARIGSRIASDHVVEVVAAGIDAASGSPWLAMELLDGETLTARVERAGPLPPAETLEVFRQLCHALGAAHSAGLVHRDIKPDNLYLAVPRREGVPFTLKILDFGIAKLNEDVRSTGGATGAVGSPMWMAPEQTSSTGVTSSTDVWALGLVAYFCLTGRSYWRAATTEDGTLQGLLKEICIDPIDPPSSRAPYLPPGFDAWFSRCVARDPSRRFADASQALAALHPVLAGAAASVAPGGPAAPAHSYPALSATSPTAVSAAASVVAERSAAGSDNKALKWLLAIVALITIGGLGLVAVMGVAFGFWFSSATSGDNAASPFAAERGADSPAPVATASAAAPTSAAPEDAPESPATKPGASGPRAPAVSTAEPPAEPDPVSPQQKQDDTDGPQRDYKLPSYRQKITQCWKGNEGAKPDAGSYSVSITLSLDESGRPGTIVVSPRTHKSFSGCAVVRTSEHPWGKGPKETKTYTFSF